MIQSLVYTPQARIGRPTAAKIGLSWKIAETAPLSKKSYKYQNKLHQPFSGGFGDRDLI